MNAHEGHATRRKALLELCTTRWTARYEAYNHFFNSYTHVVRCLEVMAHGSDENDPEEVRTYYSDWDYKTKNEANSLLTAITDFTFIVAFMIVHKYLSHLEGITRLLQSTSLDVLEAYCEVRYIKIFMYVRYVYPSTCMLLD